MQKSFMSISLVVIAISIVFICFCLIGTTNLCFYYIYIVYFCKVLFDIFLFFVNLA